MTDITEPLPPFLAEPPRIDTEISVTGKWTATGRSRRLRRPAESSVLLAAWERIHAAARSHGGVVSTEINHVVGNDAVLVHQVFSDAAALVDYYAATADQLGALTQVAEPQMHMVRGLRVPADARRAIEEAGVPLAFGEWIYGYVRDRQPDPTTAVEVTATWRCAPGDHLDELKYWWQRVGTDAHDIEPGLVRFETYEVPGADAVVIHETFTDSDALKFHLTKGTAAKYKQDIDEIAAPDAYYFRGPVAWTIRTYSKFMRLPATYSVRS
ncbi:hypothetical protein [Ilumatobacter sp.]|uniref:hypothetical protein n=1 Tax=Ilumatobacter sp. TaxID=1967498 RepID=UPI003AF804B4